MPTQPTATLLVVEREEGPVYYAKWREEGWQVKRRLGSAWIERGDAAGAGERRRTRHAGWVKRRGRPGEEYLNEDAALALIPTVIAERAAEQDRERERRAHARGARGELRGDRRHLAGASRERRGHKALDAEPLPHDAAAPRGDAQEARPGAAGTDHVALRRPSGRGDHDARGRAVAARARRRPAALGALCQPAPAGALQHLPLRLPR